MGRIGVQLLFFGRGIIISAWEFQPATTKAAGELLRHFGSEHVPGIRDHLNTTGQQESACLNRGTPWHISDLTPCSP